MSYEENIKNSTSKGSFYWFLTFLPSFAIAKSSIWIAVVVYLAVIFLYFTNSSIKEYRINIKNYSIFFWVVICASFLIGLFAIYNIEYRVYAGIAMGLLVILSGSIWREMVRYSRGDTSS